MMGRMCESGRGPLLILVMGLFMGACGGAQPPQAQLTSAESAIRAAEVGGAEDVPKGKLHLKYARDQVAEAKQLMEEKDYESAERTLMRAEVDAQYALALARHQEAHAESQKILEQIDELMDEAR